MPKVLHHGDLVLVPVPFADLTGRKVRPAVIVSADPQAHEIIVAFITSSLSNRSPRGAEVELLRSDSEFRVTGLKADSLIRLDKLVTLTRTVISAVWEPPAPQPRPRSPRCCAERWTLDNRLDRAGEVKGDTTTLEDFSVIAKLKESEEA